MDQTQIHFTEHLLRNQPINYPFGDTSRVGGTASLGSDLTRDRIMELQELLNRSHLRRSLGQAKLMHQTILHPKVYYLRRFRPNSCYSKIIGGMYISR